MLQLACRKLRTDLLTELESMLLHAQAFLTGTPPARR
jgi:hypothetical protein